jgi:uncharacterized lipoprotein YmbA
MKKLIMFSAIGLVACSSAPPQQVFVQPTSGNNVPITSVTNIPAISFVYDPDVTQMTRIQVIDAVRLCEQSGLRASPVTARRRITGQTSDVIVDVQCLPRYQ